MTRTETLRTAAHQCIRDATDYREVECEVCEGEGAWEVHTGGYDPHDGSPNGYMKECTYCKGTGRFWEQVEPITIEDLEEMEPRA